MGTRKGIPQGTLIVEWVRRKRKKKIRGDRRRYLGSNSDWQLSTQPSFIAAPLCGSSQQGLATIQDVQVAFPIWPMMKIAWSCSSVTSEVPQVDYLISTCCRSFYYWNLLGTFSSATCHLDAFSFLPFPFFKSYKKKNIAWSEVGSFFDRGSSSSLNLLQQPSQVYCFLRLASLIKSKLLAVLCGSLLVFSNSWLPPLEHRSFILPDWLLC